MVFKFGENSTFVALPQGELQGSSCESLELQPSQCLSNAESPTLLYTGGDCSQSLNIQSSTIFGCNDFNGAPPANEGDESYIVISDRAGNVYYEGTVRVGETYAFDNNGKRLPSVVFKQVYTDATRQTLLQELQFDASCRHNLFLKDQFGASQVVGLDTKGGDTMTVFQAVEIVLDIQLPSNVPVPVTLQTLTVDTNFAGTIDLSSQVFGEIVVPGQVFKVPHEFTIDPTEEREYSFLATVTALEDTLGQDCTGVDNFAFAVE